MSDLALFLSAGTGEYSPGLRINCPFRQVLMDSA